MYLTANKQLETDAGIHRCSFTWNGATWTIDTVDCEEIATEFGQILRGWKAEQIAPTSNAHTNMRFWREPTGYSWEMGDGSIADTALFGKPETLTAAVSDCHYMFNEWFVDQFNEYFTLHCAAVEVAGGVVLFPGQHRSGKSLLCAALARMGHRVFGDDLVAIDRNADRAVALGMLPRIRLPLPTQAIDAGFAEFISSNAGLGDNDNQYLELGPDQLASVGASVPIKAIVQLKRQNKKQEAALVPSSTACALRALIQQNYSRNIPASELFDHVCSIAQNVSCKQLTYHSITDAVALIEEKFGQLQPVQDCGS